MAQFERLQHDLLADLLGPGLDHDDSVLVGRDCQVEAVLRALHHTPGRIDYQLVVVQTDPAHAGPVINETRPCGREGGGSGRYLEKNLRKERSMRDS